MTRQEAMERLNGISKRKIHSIIVNNEELDKAEEKLKDIDALDMALAFLSTDYIAKAKAEKRGILRGRISMCSTILDGLDHYGKTPELAGLAGWISSMMNRYQKELDYLERRSTDEDTAY